VANVTGSRQQRQPKINLQQWEPPAGWTQTGPGIWVPPNYQPTRWEIAQPPIRNDEDAEREYIKCAKSLAYFAFVYCWTLDVDDPDGASIRKFPAYPYLRKFFNAVQIPTNTHTEKSRQMALSWAWMITFFWDVLFHQNFSGLVLSKRSVDVDDGGENSTPDSNFGKVRFIHQCLPEHLWCPVVFKKFSIRVPSTKSHIRGETGKGGKAARGPANNRALMDEAAYVEHSETVFTGLRQAAKRGTALNSTPNGADNTFYRIRFSNTTTFQKLSFHWSEHPRKSIGLYCICGWKAQYGTGLSSRDQFNAHAQECPRLQMDPPRSPEMRSPWYDRESSDMTPEKVASDLDISYSASRRGRVYTAFDQIRNVWQIYHKLGPRLVDETEADYRLRYLRMAIDPRYPCFTTKDIGVGDPTSMLFGQVFDETIPRVRILDEFEKSDESYDFFASIINTVWKPVALDVGNILSFRHFGGYDVKNRDSKLESWWSNLKLEGIHVETGLPSGDPKAGSMLEWLDFINDQFKHGFLELSEFCKHGLDAVSNYHYPIDESSGEPVPGIHLPVHDEWSHWCDALRYLYRNRFMTKLSDRKAKGVTVKRILRRGHGINPRTETRIF
jgi:hypothetical protein